MHLRKEFGVCDYGSGLAIRRRVRFVFLGKYPPQGRPFGLGEDSAFVAEKKCYGHVLRPIGLIFGVHMRQTLHHVYATYEADIGIFVEDSR